MNRPLPSELPKSLYRADQIRAMDRFAIDELGIPGIELMQRAGNAAFQVLRQRWPEARTVSVLCGSGNNGGDGYVVAKLAFEAGMDVRAFPVSAPERLQGDARTAYLAYRDIGGALLDFIPANFDGAEVLVDAILGTGLDREVADPYRSVIEAMSRYGGNVLALDIPSGLHADTGAVMGAAVKAHVTMTFIGMKQGLFTGDGPEHAGLVCFDDLDTPPSVRQCHRASAELMDIRPWALAARPMNSHKGKFGHVLMLGGDVGYSGAIRLAGEAALRVGAGLVSVGTRSEHAGWLNLNRPELMCHPVDCAGDLEPLMAKASVIAIGPGLGTSPWARTLWQSALTSGLPLVVDADALNLLVEAPLTLSSWVLTPHPGEAARLLQTTSGAIQRDRYSAVRSLQERYGGTAVLKGCGSLVLGEGGIPAVCRLGNPGMASGGMGDVLTGVIAGLLAQGMGCDAAARHGVNVHGAAGDLAARSGGERGLLASDLLPLLRELMNQ
jgi:NAD(P)H-hydrate epimerase